MRVQEAVSNIFTKQHSRSRAHFQEICVYKSLLTSKLLIGMLTAFAAMAQTPIIATNGVMNAASFMPMDFPGGSIAPGSLISIFGSNLGPVTPIAASRLPLPVELGGTEVIIDGTMRCFLVYVSAQQVNCQLPGDLTRDRIQLFLRTRDQDRIRESAPIEIRISSANFGMFGMNGNGRGPAAALNYRAGGMGEYQQNGPGTPARPGQVMLFFGTGLGRTDPGVPGGQAWNGPAVAVEQPEVYVGGVAAQVQYAGRAPGFAGLDQIQIVIPPNAPEGCAVPVRVRIRDRIQNRSQEANVMTVAIHATALRCVDGTEPVDSGSHGSVVLVSGLGTLGRGQQPITIPPGPMGPGGPGGPMMQPPSEPGSSYGYGLHPGIPPHAFGFGFQNGRGNGPDVVAARFVRAGRADVGIPPAAANACLVYYQGAFANPDLFLGAAELMDAGALTVTTPRSSLQVLPDAVAGLGVLYVEPLPEPLMSGLYTVRGAGGADVGAFGPVTLQVPSLISVTNNWANGTVISRSGPLEVTWNGGSNPDVVLIYGRVYRLGTGLTPPVAQPWNHPSLAFLCSANAGEGRFVVPPYVLEQLPLGQLSLTVTHMPSATGVSRFAAEGLSMGGMFRWLRTVTYPNLVVGQ